MEGSVVDSLEHDHQLHFFFFPLMAHGHMIPIVDMAKLFAARGHKITIITTPLNSPLVAKPIQRSKNIGLQIDIKTIRFPAVEAGLPEGCENADAISYHGNSAEMVAKFFSAIAMLQEPFENLLQESRHPDCVVADMFFPWVTDACSKFGIPRLVFHGTSFFAGCAEECIRLYSPHNQVSSDEEPFVLPCFPGEIKLTRNELPDTVKQEDIKAGLSKALIESEVKSFGAVFNSFYELEPAYADHYRSVLGRKAWHIGPVSLCNRGIEDKAERSGKEASIDGNECLKWLDSKKPNSVVYVCFGSMTNFSSAELKEMAEGLEASGQNFIWVVRRKTQLEDDDDQGEWLPEGFEKRNERKGLIIRGWAPQLLILDHGAVGGFVTHCGWNSVLEGITAGKPMVTCPLFAEQFYNEKLLTQVLRIGVGVGAKKLFEGDIRSALEKGVRRIMVGEEAEEMRDRAKKLSDKAHLAVQDGGTTSTDFDALIQDLLLNRP